jgi:hypothetical protein
MESNLQELHIQPQAYEDYMTWFVSLAGKNVHQPAAPTFRQDKSNLRTGGGVQIPPKSLYPFTALYGVTLHN